MRLKNEWKIMGSSPVLISLGMAALLSLLAVAGGDLLDVSKLGFEVLFPFFAAIAVGEWGKTRTDMNFELIAAQGRSLFTWVVFRYIAVFSTVGMAAVLGMAVASGVRNEMPLGDMLLMCFAPTMFLSTLGLLIGLTSAQEHRAVLVCGIVWLISMLVRSVLRVPGVEYIYLFICYSGDVHGVWRLNKAVLLGITGVLWCGIYLVCKMRCKRPNRSK